jgi:hypothetical protein
MMEETLTYFNESVADESLVGNGPGNSGWGRLGALRNMLEASDDLIADGYYAEACGQLTDAYNRCDGLPHPPEFVTGDAAADVAQMILDVMNALGCE